jgi:hypothetical protein
MGQTVHQIEAHIDQTREQLGSNLQELEQRVEAATDWQRYFRSRPAAFLGAAFAAGAVLGMMTPDRRARRASAAGDQNDLRYSAGPSSSDRVLDIWEIVKDAAISLAAARLTEYVDGLVPGFGDQYHRAEQQSFRTHRG